MSAISKAWLEEIAKNSGDATIILDRNRIIRYANDAAKLLSRRSGGPSELAGTSYDDIINASRIYDEDGKVPTPDQLPTYIAFRHRIATRGKILEQVFRGVHYWLSVSAIPIPDEDGTVNHAIIYFADISNRKYREDRLNFLMRSSKTPSITTDTGTRLKEQARLIVPSLADWCTVNVVTLQGRLSRIALVHRDPSKEPLVAELADRAQKVVGHTRGIWGVVHTGRPEFIPKITGDFPSGDGGDELRALAVQLSLCSSMIIPIKSRDKVVGVLSLAYAESGRNYTHEDLDFFEEFCHSLGILIDNANLYEEINKRDKAKDTFLATLSHELRNPLAPIKSSIELLRMTGQKDSEELETIENQFDHLTKLLGDLLDVSRYTLGKITLRRERTNVRSLIERVVKSQRPFLDEKNIEMRADMPDETLVLWVDQMRVEQALVNILHNAEKFTPENGRIDIRVNKKSGILTIAIVDSGIGMDTNELENLFDLHAAIPQEHGLGGLGIGLVLVREIMQLHGGMVRAHSEGKGKGSEFTLIFRTDQKEVAPKNGAANPALS